MRDAIRSVIYNRSWVLDILIGALLVSTIFFLVGQRNLTDQIKTLTEQNRQLNEETVDLGKRINDCTSPEGRCYRESTKRSATIVQQLNAFSVLRAACVDAAGTQTAKEIELCIQKATSKK